MSTDDLPAHQRPAGLERVAEFCRLALSRTEVDGMTVSIVDGFGSLEPVFGTDPLAEKINDLQFMLGQGPGTDVIDLAGPVLVPDAAAEPILRRWPLFAPEAAKLGVRALHAFPLGSGDIPLGSVLFYRRAPGALSPEQVQQATQATELVTLTLVDPEAEASIGSGLRMSVHQAAGMVMQQTGSEIRDALVLLKATAYAEDRSITDLAAEIVAGRRRFTQIHSSDGGRT